ncbi:hypothetical protein BDP27DRAFT_1244593 [Rhodocollybia butyracea]|uniref:RBR-type E3 ubiquitin transferase n=1 Tax=Rhodocollybia butyracea TaxID=206335 RepID=A0A9P5TVG3_9AGAR|nr:hypothetical protein BDP27DRAFT_1244593 [Rhodocollybia butyracea]
MEPETANTPFFTVQTCEHHYCHACLQQYIQTCLDNKSMFPPKCCGKIISLASTEEKGRSLMQALDELNPSLSARLRARATELDVPPKDHLYCPNPRCSAFLGGSAVSQFHKCPSCSERVCVLCKERHLGTVRCPAQLSLEKEMMDIKFRDLAHQKSWKTCPGCGAVVERVIGCRHILCHCRSEFCYDCGFKWEECICR